MLPADPVARRGAVFAVSVLLALIAGYFIGKSSGSSSPAAPPVAPHVHAGGGSYGLVVESSSFVAGVAQPLRFTVHAPDGAVVTRFETLHDKQLHLIVLRTDLTGYQHLHPDKDSDGVWSIPLTLPSPGSWRIFADFSTVASDGHRIDDTASAQLGVAGSYDPVALPSSSSVFDVDGVSVTMDGAVRAGGTVPLRRVSRSLRQVCQGIVESACCSSSSGGLLIHTASGRVAGSGCLRTNRSGLRV